MSTQPDASAPPGENWAEPEAQAHAHGSTSVSTIQGNSLPEPHDVVETHKQHNQGQAGVAPHQSHPAYEHGRDENVAPQATPPPPLGPAYYSYGGTPWFPHGEETRSGQSGQQPPLHPAASQPSTGLEGGFFAYQHSPQPPPFEDGGAVPQRREAPACSTETYAQRGGEAGRAHTLLTPIHRVSRLHSTHPTDMTHEMKLPTTPPDAPDHPQAMGPSADRVRRHGSAPRAR